MTPAEAVARGVLAIVVLAWISMAHGVYREARRDPDLPGWAVPIVVVFVPPAAIVVLFWLGLVELVRRGWRSCWAGL